MIIDAILCLIVIICAIIGSRRGALSGFRAVASLGVAGYLALYYSYGLSNHIYDSFVRPIIIDKLKEAIFSGRSDEADYVYYEYMKYAGQYSHKASDIAEYVTDTYLRDIFAPITEAAVGVIVFILAFVLVVLALGLLTRGLRRNSAVRGIDSVLGAVLGTVAGILIIWLIGDALYVYTDSFAALITPDIIKYVEESYIVRLANDLTVSGNFVIKDLISQKL